MIPVAANDVAFSMHAVLLTAITLFEIVIYDDVKNEVEAYMLKELSLLKWQEKATKLALEDTDTNMVELQANVSSLEENLKTKRGEVVSLFALIWSLVHIPDNSKPLPPNANVEPFFANR